MIRCRLLRPLPMIAAMISGCAGAPKPAEGPVPATLCERWSVTVENEFPYPVSVFVYTARDRMSLGVAPPGTTKVWSPDSGQVTFTPPPGLPLIARGRQIRGVVRCALRAPS